MISNNEVSTLIIEKGDSFETYVIKKLNGKILKKFHLNYDEKNIILIMRNKKYFFTTKLNSKIEFPYAFLLNYSDEKNISSYNNLAEGNLVSVDSIVERGNKIYN